MTEPYKADSNRSFEMPLSAISGLEFTTTLRIGKLRRQFLL